MTRWNTRLSPKVVLPYAINFRVLRGANLVTLASKCGGNETLVVHRAEGSPSHSKATDANSGKCWSRHWKTHLQLGLESFDLTASLKARLFSGGGLTLNGAVLAALGLQFAGKGVRRSLHPFFHDGEEFRDHNRAAEIPRPHSRGGKGTVLSPFLSIYHYVGRHFFVPNI